MPNGKPPKTTGEHLVSLYGYVQGFKTLKNAIGSYIPVDQHRPIASIGNMKSPYPTAAYALNATAKGPGLGTFKPINIISRKNKK